MDSEADFHAKQLYAQGSYNACIATINSLSSAAPSLQLYAARSHLALGDTASALKLATGSAPAARAVRLLAQRPPNAVSDAQALLNAVQPEQDGYGTVHAVLGTLLQLEGETGEALSILAEGADAEDQECVALQVQILISQDRLDLARQAYEQAKTWAEDSLIIQLCEAWLGLRTGGDAYQSAYYVFDEVAQLPSANNVVVLNGKAVAQAAQGNWPEAEAALNEANEIKPDFPSTIANSAALASIAGKSLQSNELFASLRQKASTHPLIVDLEEKSALFDEAAAKYGVAAA